MAKSRKADHSTWWLALAGIVGAVVGAAITGQLELYGPQGRSSFQNDRIERWHFTGAADP